MRVLFTGATGLIGREIVKQLLLQNVEVHYLTTSMSKLVMQKNYKGFYWNPYKNIIDSDCFNGVDVIVHLTGAVIAKRWTKSYKKEIINSRVQVAKFLYKSLKNQPNKVKQIVSASAIGVYPSSLTHYYDETEQQLDNSFLGNVVQQWEEAVSLFEDMNINVAKIRIGLVLSANGGVLPSMIKPIKFGLGTIFGRGDQWQSWIHIDDLTRVFMFVLNNNLNGIYNAVAPNPVTHKEFVKTLAKILNRRILLPNIPKSLMKLLLGEMHMLLFLSQRVSSKKIENLGFEFKFFHLKSALNNLTK